MWGLEQMVQKGVCWSLEVLMECCGVAFIMHTSFASHDALVWNNLIRRCGFSDTVACKKPWLRQSEKRSRIYFFMRQFCFA